MNRGDGKQDIMAECYDAALDSLALMQIAYAKTGYVPPLNYSQLQVHVELRIKQLLNERKEADMKRVV